MVHSVDVEVASCYRLLYEALDTHKLTMEDKRWGARIMCSAMEGFHGVDRERQLCMIGILLCKNTTTGRFALTFNQAIDNLIRNHDIERINRLTRSNKEYLYPELYMNNLLIAKGDRSDAIVVERVFISEHEALCDAIEQSKEYEGNKVFNILPCEVVEWKDDSDRSIYNSCYGRICTNIKGSMVSSNQSSSYMNYADSQQNQAPKFHCFRVIDLTRAFVENPSNPINPGTGKPFNPRFADILRNKIRIEIMLYDYYYHSVVV